MRPLDYQRYFGFHSLEECALLSQIHTQVTCHGTLFFQAQRCSSLSSISLFLQLIDLDCKNRFELSN